MSSDSTVEKVDAKDFNWENDDMHAGEQSWRAFFSVIGTVWRLSVLERKRLIRGFLWMALRTGVEPISAYLLALVISGARSVSSEGARMVAFPLVAFALLRILDVVVDQYFSARNFWEALMSLWYRWPQHCQEKLLELPAEFHEQHGMSKQVSKITKGCNQLGNMTIDLFYSFLPAIMFWAVNLLILLIASWITAFALMVPITIAISLFGRMQRKRTKIWDDFEKRGEEATKDLIQGVVAAPMVQAFVQEQRLNQEQETTRSEIINDEHVSLSVERIYYVLLMTLLAVGFICSVSVAYWQLQRGEISHSVLAYVCVASWTTVAKFWEVLHVYRRMLRSAVTIERVRMLLETPNTLGKNADGHVLDDAEYALTCTKLSFQYQGKQNGAVKDVSLTIPSGKMIACVGASGAGKSTFAKLLMLVYRATSGGVYLNGHDITTLSRDWYRGLFASVSQDSMVLDRSIEENVRFGAPIATDDEVVAAIRAAHLEVVLSDAERFPLGVKTVVGERGAMISGGERQRIGIARAYLKLLHGAKFLVLDEATSSLDSEAEAAIHEVVERLRQRQSITIIAIAHRLSTIKNADLICVFDRGELVERGTHADLIKQGGRYANLVSHQNLHTIQEAFVT